MPAARKFTLSTGTTTELSLHTSDFGLRTSDFGFRTSDFGLRTSHFDGGCRANQDFALRLCADNTATPNCCSMPNSSELPQRSTILPSLNLDICTPRIFIFRPVGAMPISGPFCVPVMV